MKTTLDIITEIMKLQKLNSESEEMCRSRISKVTIQKSMDKRDQQNVRDAGQPLKISKQQSPVVK